MNPQRLFQILGLALVCSVLAACASAQAQGQEGSESPESRSPGELIIRGQEEDPSKLGPMEFLSVTQTVEDPGTLEVSPWSKLRLVSSLLDTIKGHDRFTNEQKATLLSFLVDDLPINMPTSFGVAREVYIGKYFDNGDPLGIRIGIAIPSSQARLKNNYVIMILTNVVQLPNGTLVSREGKFIGMDNNASMFMGLRGDLLTDGNHMSDGTNIPDPALLRASSIERVMTAQGFILDEDPSNDTFAKELADSVLAQSQEMPAIRIMAMLMAYNYYLSVVDLPKARAQWQEILTLSPQVPGDMTPEALETMNGASLYQLGKILGR